ncbi:hypothetical protein EDB92DRAFT_1818469 [Lactarius akahatsu]|uniref:VWFA domain-containing protein n=1 Tax=Lactarius akahatsu TaxID=416441 RepID=A0AAD4LDZ4_9AGAM|nr:hypothetical protein EDB92DRAFT_1818469 [Lactarius akahatsu]
MYPLLDLITEQGSSGLVDKIIIAQESLQEFINALSPGAYSSITKVNFKILDNVFLKPLGIYGSKEEIARFLREINAVDDNTNSAQKLLMPDNEHTAGSPEPVLRSGLYIVRSFVSTSEEQVYLVYWPEETTWDDRAHLPIQRNRVTFMRYLSKLCDQLVYLLSSEHSRALVWGNDDNNEADEEDDDGGGTSTDSEQTDSDRFFRFQVAKTKDQEENVVARAGFVAPPPDSDTDPRALRPALLHGEKVQDFMTPTFVPATKIVEPFSFDAQSAEQIQLRFGDGIVLCLSENSDIVSRGALVTALGLRTRFPEVHKAWESKLEEVRADMDEVVVGASLKLFPSLRRERILTESSSKPPAEATVDTKVESNLLRDLFLLYPRMEQTLWDAIRDADIGSCLSVPEFHFKKERLLFLRILDSGSHGTMGLSTDQTRRVADAVLKQQDKRSTLAVLETFAKDDEGIFSRIKGFFRSTSGEEGSWQSASKRASSVPDSQFLSDLKTIPVDNYLYEAAVDVEGTAYALLTKRVDTLVSRISQNILLAQRKECDKQVRREAEIEEAGQVQVLWSEFVRKVKDESAQRSTSDDSHKVQLDPSYVPIPILEKRLTHSFRASSSTVVKYDMPTFLKAVGFSWASSTPHGNIEIYFESLTSIDVAIQRRSFARLFHRDKIDETCLFAVDESKRLLGVYSSTTMQLHIFAFGEENRSLRGIGSAIHMLPFYNNGVSIVHACFVHRREEILPASLQLPQVPRAIYSSPDGSCALFVQEKDGISTVTAYHWTTFASTDGIPITLPDFPVDIDAALLTSIVNHITCKAAEFTFQEQHSKALMSHGKETAHNCLIDCHSEVWTRFPVVPAVKRRTITPSSDRQQKTLTFVTDDDQRPFSSYFSEMIRSFTKTSRKPTGNVLKGITISVRTFPSFANQFVPLKDGILSTQLEKWLLGAEVNKIVDSLSVGWYESIFQSYWASKPVKVVSSMGEQSVGKSFTLNHLLDTSFAGSAMRTTEGVWLSVSPTNDELIVALDFEGVHSLERSAQEDTLLVLFNTALSNLVLFRNNFALSRDITGLFQSFQSSTSILDPASNPSLFQSTLLVIIKFQKIVENERDSNFITRLHAGKLHIIPWPVIESEGFYQLFRKVKRALDQQPTSHHTAGGFLLTLKMLMAKLKANDWGAMSQTMAMHRASALLAILPSALETGLSEIHPEPVPLKNFDTDVVIEAVDTEARFVLTGPSSSVADHECPLAVLRGSWDQTIHRQYLDDSEWHSDLVHYLAHLVDLRVAHVENWLESNICGPASNSVGPSVSIVALFANATVSQLSPVVKPPATQGIIFSVHLCGEPCELSGSRACTEICVKVTGDADTPIVQILMWVLASQSNTKAATSARLRSTCAASRAAWLVWYFPTEICLHVLGHVISLSNPAPLRLGPQNTRITSAKTEGALFRVNFATECVVGVTYMALSLAKITFAAKNVLAVPCAPRVYAKFKRNLMPSKLPLLAHMQLFNIQGRDSDNSRCAQYKQVAKPLPCAKVIKPGEVEHPGLHIHSNDNKPFHYCDSRTDLSAGHPQQEHETSHGSMSQTRWVVDDPDGTGLEIEGHKFSSNDNGGPMLCNLLLIPIGQRTGSHTVYIGAEWVSEVTRVCGSTRFILADVPEDPYSQDDQANFAQCDAMCPGPDHTSEGSGASTQPSSCTLPIFHAPLRTKILSPGPGYISSDGHHFTCKSPALLQPAFHVIFVIDKSGSMLSTDQTPLPNAPGSNRITQKENNRLEVVFSSLYSFWIARQATFDRNAHSPDELLIAALQFGAGGGTNFTRALKRAQDVMTSHWSTERTPVVIFLSDGRCEVSDECINDICHTASRRGMVDIAKEVQKTVPQNVLTVNLPSSFTNVLDTVCLTTTFQGFAESLAKPRGNLLSS